MRAIGAGVARLDVGQRRWVKTVVGNPHRLGAVADERADDVDRVFLAVRESQRLVRHHQVRRPLPDQRAYAVGAFVQVQDADQAADIGGIAHDLERRHGVERHQEERTAHAERHPDNRHAAVETRPHGAEREQHEEVDAKEQPDPGATALRPEDRHDLDQQHKEVGAARQRGLPVLGVGPYRLPDAQQAHKAAEYPFERDKERDDQHRAQENGVPGVACYARGRVAAPGQRVDVVVLHYAVDRAGQADDDDGVLQPPHLLGPPQRRRRQPADQDIGEESIGALQALVRAKPADKAGYAEERTDGIRQDQQCHRDKERVAHKATPVLARKLFRPRSGGSGQIRCASGCARPSAGSRPRQPRRGRGQPGKPAVGHLDQPRHGHGQSQRPDQADLIRLKHAARKHIKKERRHYHGGQPPRLQHGVAPAIQFAAIQHDLFPNSRLSNQPGRCIAIIGCTIAQLIPNLG